jgi:hypothetical protein
MSNLNAEQLAERRKEMMENLKQVLPTSIVTVDFIKSDGTLRTMRCTTSAKIVPQQLREASVDDAPQRAPRKPNPDVMAVYDVEAKAWRSFRWDRLQSYSYNIMDLTG